MHDQTNSFTLLEQHNNKPKNQIISVIEILEGLNELEKEVACVS